MTGANVNAAASAANGQQQQHHQRRPARRGRRPPPKRQHFHGSRGAPPFAKGNHRLRSGRSLPRPSWTEGASHGSYSYDEESPHPRSSDGSRQQQHNNNSNSNNNNNNNNSHQPSQYNGNGGGQYSPRAWWTPFSTADRIPSAFLPRECTTCNKSPTTSWTMVDHLCSFDHCQNVITARNTEYERSGQTGPPLCCELCRVPLLSIQSAKNHLWGGKHQGLLRMLKGNLRSAGCNDVPPDSPPDNRCSQDDEQNRSSRRSSSRGNSIESENVPEAGNEARDGTRSPTEKPKDTKTPNGKPQTQSPQTPSHSNTNNNNDAYSNKDRWKQPAIIPARERRSAKEEEEKPKVEGETRKIDTVINKDSPKHQYFLNSEEEHSEDDDEDEKSGCSQKAGTSMAQSDATGAPKKSSEEAQPLESRPKIPLNRPLLDHTRKSPAEKRKEILSNLGNCADVRDLTKQLRKICRGSTDKQKKTLRRSLPGVVYSNLEIARQETFAEARAKLEGAITIDESEPTPSTSQSGSMKSGEANSMQKRRFDDDDAADCTVVVSPPKPPPQTISDSEDGEEERPQRLPNSQSARPSTTSTPSSTSATTGPLPNDEFIRIAMLTSEESACQERLRYLSQTLARTETLIRFLRQEEQAILSQLELIRAAKSRQVSILSQASPPPPGAEVFGPNQVINAIINPPVRPTDNLSWLLNSGMAAGTGQAASPYSLHSVLGLTSPSPAPAPPPPSINAAVATAATIATATVESKSAGDARKRSITSPAPAASAAMVKRSRIAEMDLDEQLHSEQVLAVHLNGDFVYTSSRDGIVKRTPLVEGAGPAVLYEHCGQDSNSSLKRVCAYMIEVSVHKKMHSVKVITGSDDCAMRIFDGDSGHLMKVIPVQARVLCGFIAWQKVYIGLKSGYIQVYNLLDQRFLVESEVRQVPRFVASLQTSTSKNVVVVTQDNAMMLRDAGTLFLLYAVDKRDQKITALIVKDDNILLAGESKVYIFDKGGRLCREVELEEEIYGAVALKTNLFVALKSGCLTAFRWKALMGGQLQRKGQLSWKSMRLTPAESAAEVVVGVHSEEASKRAAIATEGGRITVVNCESIFERSTGKSADDDG